MCGVLAILGCPVAREGRGPAPAPGWDGALDRLSRRGPDGRGTWEAPSGRAILGHTRLAIQDLSPAGAQPMTDAAGRVALSYNGEVYNAPALRRELERAGRVFGSRADTEVLVHGYLEWGFAGLLDRLVGMFALVLWDEERGEALAAVDPSGMKPLAWAVSDGRLHVASDCDALRCILARPPGVDPAGLCHVLCLGYCPAPATVWGGVQKLEPGQAMRWRPGDAAPVVWRYWSPPEAVDPDQPADFEPLWREVVGDHLLSDVPVGLFLSGGLDSSGVAAALRDVGRTDVPCFTLALPGADDEGPAAGRTASHLGLPHIAIPMDAPGAPEELHAAARAFDEPQAYGALLTATAIARAARPFGKVMLAGDGGDEAFAGYAWHRAAPRVASGTAAGRRGNLGDHAWLAARVASPDADGATRAMALRQLASLSFLHAHLQAVFPRFHPAEAAALLGARYDEHAYAAWAGEHDRPGLPWPRRAQRLDLLTFCAGSILPKIDRSSMAVGLELRAPFLDRRVLTWALSRPVEVSASAPGASKGVLRTFLRGRVPGEVLSRPKQGFSLRLGDPGVWVSRLPWVAETRLVRDGLLRPDYARFVGEDAPHRGARAFALCMLAAWHEERA